MKPNPHGSVQPWQKVSAVRCLVFAALTMYAASPGVLAQDQIYKVVDKEKGVVFTDKPPTVTDSNAGDVEAIELQETNRAKAVEVAPRPVESQTEIEADIAKSVSISAPANETTIAMGPGNFSVTASPEPALERSERLQLLYDGQPMGEPQATTSWFIQGALRGPHDLIVQRQSRNGSVISSSSPVRVYVLRPSVLNRR
ncbi:MAG: hypothetical protein AAF662_07150 [Pseudomonadota bacterium]